MTLQHRTAPVTAVTVPVPVTTLPLSPVMAQAPVTPRVSGIHPWGVKIGSDGRDNHLKGQSCQKYLGLSSQNYVHNMCRIKSWWWMNSIRCISCMASMICISTHFLSKKLTLLVLCAVSKLDTILRDACLGTTNHLFSTHLWGRSG